jgi:hypothetical protein
VLFGKPSIGYIPDRQGSYYRDASSGRQMHLNSGSDWVRDAGAIIHVARECVSVGRTLESTALKRS